MSRHCRLPRHRRWERARVSQSALFGHFSVYPPPLHFRHTAISLIAPVHGALRLLQHFHIRTNISKYYKSQVQVRAANVVDPPTHCSSL